MAHLIRSGGEAAENCLAHALLIAIAKAENDPDYKAYRQGRKILLVVQNLLTKTGIDLSGGVGIPELIKFQEHFRDYKITVSRFCVKTMLGGQVDSPKRINLLCV
jgi:hypothetical protein